MFCEWPLGTSTAQAAALTKLAEAAKVRTVIGLQRRLSPGVRYLRDLLAEGYAGTLRSVTLHAAIPMMGARRKAREAYTADVANGAHTFSVFAAHYLDTLLAAVGPLRDVSGIVARQFNETTLMETDEVIPVTAPDQVLSTGRWRVGRYSPRTSRAASAVAAASSSTSRGRKGTCSCPRTFSSPGRRERTSRSNRCLLLMTTPGCLAGSWGRMPTTWDTCMRRSRVTWRKGLGWHRTSVRR